MEADRRVKPYSNTENFWHLDKRINLAMIITLIVVAGSFIVAGYDIYHRFNTHDDEIDSLKKNQMSLTTSMNTMLISQHNMTYNTKEIDTLKDQYRRRETQLYELRKEILGEIKSVNNKLDRIVEKRIIETH